MSALAGYCTTVGGERVAFAFLMNGVYPSSARAVQDRMTVALARYDAYGYGALRGPTDCASRKRF